MKFNYDNLFNIEMALALSTKNVPCKVIFNDDDVHIELCGWGEANMMLKPNQTKEEIMTAIKNVRWD